MNPERWAKIKPIFHAASDRPAPDRSDFIRAQCKDESLALEIESLLAAHNRAESFIESPALDHEPPNGAIDSTDYAGKLIGPYRIIRRIGTGGMGAVYLAARADQAFEKQVAVKLIRGGLGADFLVQRFIAERQMLAGLEHPNIARLIDGGATEEGYPYLVMEYVEGKPLNEYCDHHRLLTEKRLNIFRSVCAAVHYAHQNLIVHRDIKPGNILVTAAGEPKLLDFGIAKFLSPEVAGNQTTVFSRMMTPDYASPEQARGETITTASDIYSMGVLLYELLTGCRPYSLSNASPLEVARIICESEPSKPSTAVAHLAPARLPDPAAVTEKSAPTIRRREPAADKLRRQLEGDLDNIVLKALRKEPNERYGSAQELSDDIRRYLDGIPVIARPATFGYRASKFIRRHRWGVAAASLFALLLVGAAIATSWQAMIAKRESARAEKRFNDVRRLANSFIFDIHDEIRQLPGSTQARQRLVATAQDYLNSLSAEAHGNVDLLRELAAAYERLGDVQGGKMDANFGDTEGALESYRRARQLLEGVLARRSAEINDTIALAHLEVLTAVTLRGMGRLQDAAATYQLAIDRLERVLGAEASREEDVRRSLCDSYQKLADTQEGLGLIEMMKHSIEKAIEHGEAVTRSQPDDTEAQSRLAAAYYSDSLALRQDGDQVKALARTRQARAIQEALLQKEPFNQRYVRGLLYSFSGESLCLQELGEGREAVRVGRRAVELSEDMLRRDPQDNWAQTGVTVSYSELGRALIRIGENTEALVSLKKARQIGLRVATVDPENAFLQNELAIIDCNLGYVLRAGASGQEACKAFARSLETLAQLRARGALTADSAKAVREVEQQVTKCDSVRDSRPREKVAAHSVPLAER